MSGRTSERDLERNIGLLCTPFGDDAHVRMRERAAQWLLDHVDMAHPRLLALLASGESTNPLAIVEVLPRFGRAESVPALAALLNGDAPSLKHGAAQALARHPVPAAGQALRVAMQSPHAATLIAAADGLMARDERGDRAACDALRPALAHKDADVRYHALQAAGRLACVSNAELTRLLKDADADVRELARRLSDRA